VALAQLDDLAGEESPINVPGTTTERHNWRRRQALTVKDIFSDTQARKIIGAMSQSRVVP